MKRGCSFLLIVPLLILQACAPTPQQPEPAPAAALEQAPAVAVDQPPAADPFTDFDTTISVRDLMKNLIDPNARELWRGVSYVRTEQGVVETIPQTQGDWDALRANAIALIEGSNALMLPGRRMDVSTMVEAAPDFQFTPQEIEQLRIDDPDSWVINLQAMQDAVLQTLEKIDRKDILGFTERAAVINESCETCHAQYWYKPLSDLR
jgi:hypothetical protein